MTKSEGNNHWGRKENSNFFLKKEEANSTIS